MKKIRKLLSKFNLDNQIKQIQEVNNKKYIIYCGEKNNINSILKISFNKLTSNQSKNEYHAYKFLKKKKHTL